MHQLFAAFIAMLFSFCHHSATSRPADAFVSMSQTYTVSAPAAVLTFPDRQDLAHAASGSSYADAACLSCQTTPASYSER